MGSDRYGARHGRVKITNYEKGALNMDKAYQKVLKNLDNLKVARNEAQAKLDEATAKIDLLKADLGNNIGEGKAVDLTELEALKGGQMRQELVLSAIDAQVVKAERELEKAKEAQYQADIQAFRDEGKKQLIEIVKALDALYKLSAVYRGFERRANAQLLDDHGRSGLTSMGVPVQDVFLKTDIWLGRSSMYNKKMMEFIKEAGVLDYIERKAFAEKEFKGNAKM